MNIKLFFLRLSFLFCPSKQNIFITVAHYHWLALELLDLWGDACWAGLCRMTIRTHQFQNHNNSDGAHIGGTISRERLLIHTWDGWKNGEWSSYCPEKRKNVEYRLSNLEIEPWWRLLGIILWEMNRKQFIGERARSSDSGWMWNGLQISVIGSTSYACDSQGSSLWSAIMKTKYHRIKAGREARSRETRLTQIPV